MIKQNYSILSVTCSLPKYLYTQSSLLLTAAGVLTQGQLQPLRVNSFIHFKPAVTPLLVYRIPSSKQALPPFLILSNLNWYLQGCPVKCVQFRDIILLLEMVGANRIERWMDTGGLEGPLARWFYFWEHFHLSRSWKAVKYHQLLTSSISVFCLLLTYRNSYNMLLKQSFLLKLYTT